MERNNFESLTQDKNEFIDRLALDDELAKCLICNELDFQKATITEEDKYNLIYNQIYPFPKVMSTTTEAKSYITMRFKYRKSKESNYFKAASITFYCFCHESLIQTAYMTLRYDYMLQQIDRLINDTRGEGWIGKMAFENLDDITVDTEGKFIGVAVTYRNTEFQ